MAEYPDTQFASTSKSYRRLIDSFLEKKDFESAAFWAKQVIPIGNCADKDVETLFSARYDCGEFLKAANLLISDNYDKNNLSRRCLIAKCLYKAGKLKEALEMLDIIPKLTDVVGVLNMATLPKHHDKTVIGQMYLVKGKILDALGQHLEAIKQYGQAIVYDIYCFQALELFLQKSTFTAMQVSTLIGGLPFEKLCRNGDHKFVKDLYMSAIANHFNPSHKLNFQVVSWVEGTLAKLDDCDRHKRKMQDGDENNASTEGAKKFKKDDENLGKSCSLVNTESVDKDLNVAVTKTHSSAPLTGLLQSDHEIQELSQVCVSDDNDFGFE